MKLLAESLDEYVARLEGASDTQRLKVPASHSDRAGNPIAFVVLNYGVDTDGTPHELVDTSGYPILQSTWPGGSTVSVDGTFTKSGAGTGRVIVTPAPGDELIAMFGRMTWGAKAGAGTVYILMEDTSGNDLIWYSRTQNAGANENLSFFGLSNPQDSADDKGGVDIGPLGALVTSTEQFTFEVGNMANTEAFTVRARFRSKLGSTPTITAAGGAWA